MLKPEANELLTQVGPGTPMGELQELGGLVWAYLGPEPAPLLPRWDIFVTDGMYRQILGAVLDCNWLQCMENRLDTCTASTLHGNFLQYILEPSGKKGASEDGMD